MGIKERKAREKAAFRKLVLDTAHTLLKIEGLEAIKMRTIAATIEYSQSKIYEAFSSKDELCEALCQDLSKKLLQRLKETETKHSPIEHLKDVFNKTTEFHLEYPHSDSLFTLIYFGSGRFKIPEALLLTENCFKEAVKQLNFPGIQSEKEISDALDIFRCIFVGVATLMSAETSLEGKKRVQAMSMNALQVLIKGWAT